MWQINWWWSKVLESILLRWRPCWWQSLNYILRNRALLGPVCPRVTSTPDQGGVLTQNRHIWVIRSSVWGLSFPFSLNLMFDLLSRSSSYCCSYAVIISLFNTTTNRRIQDRTGTAWRSRHFRLVIIPRRRLVTYWEQLSASRVGPLEFDDCNLVDMLWPYHGCLGQQPDHRLNSSEGILKKVPQLMAVVAFRATMMPRARFQKRSDHCDKVIGSVISRQITISRSDRIPRTILLRLDHDPGPSCSLRGLVLDQKFHHNNWSQLLAISP